ncbi:outer membrane protein transport protein [Winogradskyella maritima]|uniref:OmpP1/FadL family transporter n=1 Tax=Winogradskyella maritima TaxID=1517766 RepID=A0ABV8AIE9_9FLAO|nr:outer membrane protein transport protein [Winogradskyella maritima]
MRKFQYFVIATLAMATLNAQDISDAVRLSTDNVEGTARFKGMSGAFGALGGDMSAVSINPAGSSIFNNSHASASLGFGNNRNDTFYFEDALSSQDSSFDLNQAGASFVYLNGNQNSPWRKFALALAYDKTGNFNDNWTARGVSPTANIGDYFLEYARGLPLADISALEGETLSDAYFEIGQAFGFGHQQAFLGYESFILDPENETDDNTAYINTITGGNYDQQFAYNANGYNGTLAFNASAQYGDNLHIGLNVNSHFVNYERSTFFSERNNNASAGVNRVGFENILLTNGVGLSFQLGSILKLDNGFRLGLAYDSPTWYRITEESYQYLETTVNDGDNAPFSQVIDPGFFTLFPDYRFRSPSKITASVAYVALDKGLLSFDYSRKNFSNAEFRPNSDPFFQFQNDDIENRLKDASTYRFGAEYRIERISLRGGYSFEESPYEDESFFGNRTGYSLGLGYKFGNTTLDVAFNSLQRQYNYQFFGNSQEFTNASIIDNVNTNVVLTLGFSI